MQERLLCKQGNLTYAVKPMKSYMRISFLLLLFSCPNLLQNHRRDSLAVGGKAVLPSVCWGFVSLEGFLLCKVFSRLCSARRCLWTPEGGVGQLNLRKTLLVILVWGVRDEWQRLEGRLLTLLVPFLHLALCSPEVFSSSIQVEKRFCSNKLVEMPQRASKMLGIPQMPGKCSRSTT